MASAGPRDSKSSDETHIQDTRKDSQIDEDTSDEEDQGEDSNKPVEQTQEKEERLNKRIGKKAQKDQFAKWFAQTALSIQLKKDKNAEDEADKQADELKSARALLSMKSNHIISDPREYQLELFERAKLGNTLAVLDTGSGKTLIATLLIRHILDQELEDRAAGKNPRVCIFLVDSVTLVFQQGAVLECNLDTQVGKYYGEMGVDTWNAKAWTDVLQKDKVIIATAQIILDCLAHSFLKLDQVNLLIFDECHHAKKNHAYARIMRDFYVPLEEAKRPRIFGMTASPVDARVDVVKAASELELLLHSRICTTSDLTLLQKFFSRPVEKTLVYDRLLFPKDTHLVEKLAAFKNVSCLKPLFTFSRIASSQLGTWCADQVWKFALTELEATRQERRVGMRKKDLPDDPEILEEEMKAIRAAYGVVQNHTFENLQLNREMFSSKLQTLCSFLRQKYFKPTDYRCIIFVNRRYTAKVLSILFEELSFPNIRLGTLLGSSGTGIGYNGLTFKEQAITMYRFRKGIYNCLISTSVAEEGVDIPDCNLVIRFDLYSTMIQYVQSRGRARHQTSEYVHMAEDGNSQHAQAICDVQQAENVMKSFCTQLPEDRLLDRRQEINFSQIMNDNARNPSITIPETGAKLTLNSAIQTINHFIGRLSTSLGYQQCAIFSFHPLFGKGYKCEIILPPESPITTVEGWPCASKARAKQAAAYDACRLLYEKKYLDQNLLPIYTEKLRPLMANAHLAVDLFKTHTYDFKLKPSFWDIKTDDAPQELWVNVLYLEEPEEYERKSQPIAMLSRQRTPVFPTFSVYFDRGGTSLVKIVNMSKPLQVSEDIFAKLTSFTFRFFRDVFNKRFEMETSTIPYWVLPVCKNLSSFQDLNFDILFDWQLIEFVHTHEEIAINPNDPNQYIDKFLIDRRSRSRRFFVSEVDLDLTQLSPIPDGACTAPFSNNIIDYSYDAGKKGWEKWKGEVPEHQPVLVSHRVLHRINMLDPATEREKTQVTLAYICPSAFVVSVLPTTVCAMGMVFPSISSRIDSYLHALDVCRVLKVDIALDVALEAITKDADNTEEHGEDPQNKRRGMGENYERLEFLGDCYLKLATTIALYSQNPDNDEFEYHVKRMLLICNQNLYNRAQELRIPKYIQTEGFSRRLWYPRMRLLEGKGVNKIVNERTHKLGDKSIADVCEALIGAAFQDKGFSMASRVVTSLLKTSEHEVKDWSDYYKLYKIPEYQSASATASQIELAKQVKSEIGYSFKYPRLLRSAFTHPSLPSTWEKVPSYQRLEFLGDALIDQACVMYLWEFYPGKDPQWLTEHKMSMINNKFQGALCVLLGFHKHIRLMGGQLSAQITEYVTLVEEAKMHANGALNYWVDVKAPPKALPDVLEAVVGAMFVDAEYDFSVVKTFFDKFFLPFFQDITLYDDFAGNHPVTLLQNKMTGLGCDDWRMFSQEFKDRDTSYVLTAVMIHNEIFADSRNATIKNARIAAAKRATDKLERIGIEAFYEICNCETIREDARVEMEKIKEKNKEYRKMKKKGFMQNEAGNKDDHEGELDAAGETVEEQAAVTRKKMDNRFIDLDLDAKKGLVQGTLQPKTNGVTEDGPVGNPLEVVQESLHSPTIQTHKVDEKEEDLISFD